MKKKFRPEDRLSQLVGLRLRREEYLALKGEAGKHGLDLLNYIRMLLKTHQGRKGRK